MKSFKSLLIGLLFTGSLLHASNGQAQEAGDIDTTWATNGWLFTDHVSNEGEVIKKIRKVSGDRFMAIGHTTGANWDMLLVRYNNDGTIDSSFSDDGILEIDASIGGADGAYDLVEMSDGRMIVAGSSVGNGGVELVLTRLEEDGGTDVSFGTQGYVRYSAGAGTWTVPSEINLQSDYNIFVGASLFDGVTWDMAVLKFTQGGGLTASFGNNGLATLPGGASNDDLKGIAVGNHGEVYFVGNADFIVSTSAVLGRFNAEGVLDTNFNEVGYIEYNPSNINNFNDVLLDENGAILVAGFKANGMDADGLVLKYDTLGHPDSSFALDGVLTMDIGASDGLYYHDLDQQTDGDYIVTGRMEGNAASQFHAFTFDANGTADCEFACAGAYYDLTIQTVSMDQTLLEVMDDGSIITGGTVTSQDFIGENVVLMKLIAETQLLATEDFFTLPSAVKVFPNPTVDHFRIEGSAQTEVRLISMQGSIIQTWKGNDQAYYLNSHVVNGTYIVQVLGAKKPTSHVLVVNR